MGSTVTRTIARRNSGVRQVIIQCPSCQTKFALEQNSLEGIDEPRFHCSRCDHVFGLDEGQRDLKLVEGAAAETSPSPEDPPSWRRSESPKNLPRNPSRSLEIPPISEEVRRSRPPHENAEEEPEPDASNSSQMAFEFSALDSAIDDQPLPHKSRRAFAPAGGEPHPDLTGPERSVSRDTGAEEYSQQFKKESLMEELGEKVEREAAVPPPSGPLKTSVIPQAAESYQPAESYQAASHQASIGPSHFGPSHFGQWRSMTALLSPLMLFMAALVALVYYLRIDNSAASTFSDLLFASAPRMAPAGLYIKNTRLKKIVLETGDTVQVVSGRIQNDSADTFKEILLEAIAFDALGKPISKLKVQASPALAKTRIKSLTPEMIKNVQQNQSGNFSLRPGQNLDFSMALGESLGTGELNKAKYFSARVFSVRR
jgi:predicted Zn finger-like uncharacterized protein